MEVDITENTGDRLSLDVYGSDVTMAELLRKKLMDDPAVKLASYSVPHPLLDGIHVEIEMSKGNADAALEKAVTDIEKDIETFKKKFPKK